MTKLLRNPPLLEAICEIQCAPAASRPLTAAGVADLQGQQQGRFALLEQLQDLQLGLEVRPVCAGQDRQKQDAQEGAGERPPSPGQRSANLSPHATARPRWMLSSSANKERVLQYTDSTFSVHVLQPHYDGWDAFRDLFLTEWLRVRGHYHTAGPCKVVLRYLNHVRKDTAGQPLSAWLRASELLPSKLLEASQNFAFQLQLPQAHQGETLQLLLADTAAHGQKAAPHGVGMDLSTSLSLPAMLQEGALRAALQRLHDRLEDVFFSSAAPQAFARWC